MATIYEHYRDNWNLVLGTNEAPGDIVEAYRAAHNGRDPGHTDIGHAIYRHTVEGTPISDIWSGAEPPPAPSTSLPPFDDVWDVQTDFLHLGLRQGRPQRSTLFSMTQSADMVKENCALIRAIGGDTYVFYVYNENDGGWNGSGAGGPFNGYTDEARTLKLTELIRDNGCHPLPCLIPDDAPALNGGPLTEPSKAVSKMREWWPSLLPKLAQRMERKILWLYLEGNEYLWPEEEIKLIKLAHETLPDFKLLVHWTRGRPAASPVLQNKGKPKNEWAIPDPYEWEGPWWKKAEEVGGNNVGMAYQSGETDPDDFRTDLAEKFARARGREGNWGVTFKMILGECDVNLSVEQIDRHAKVAREVGVKGSLHGVQR